jgi:hypothetical protein
MPLRQMLLQRVGPGSLCRGMLLGLAERGLDRLQPSLQLLNLPPECLELNRCGLTLLPRPIDLAVHAILDHAHVAFLRDARLLGL